MGAGVYQRVMNAMDRGSSMWVVSGEYRPTSQHEGYFLYILENEEVK